jgi:two-component system, chemotaxis family, protein-glutamate methylesterase/glutaminase
VADTGWTPSVVVVGASAGGVEALSTFVAALPPDLDAAVLVVLHLPAAARSRLPEILGKAAPLPTERAVDGAPLAPGRVLVAPVDTHLLVRDGRVLLSSGAKENGHRPAVDVLFRSAARWLGPRAAAVVLSGLLDDGAAGAAAIAVQGGAVLVQDPEEALFESMPQRARAAVPQAQALPVRDIARALPDVLRQRADRPSTTLSRDLVLETDMAQMDEGAVSGIESPGRAANVSCPECHGAMTRVQTGAACHYRCHVGHAYGPASLLQAQAELSEAALWTAVASLEERVAVHRDTAESSGDPDGRALHLARAEDVQAQARALRRQLRSSAARP